MIHFGSYKRNLQRSIRENIYAWMSSGKNVASLVSTILPINRKPPEFPLGKAHRVREDNTFTDKSRKRQSRFIFWGIELLLAVGFDVAKRYVKSWTASLAKEETPLRRRVSEPKISGETKSQTITGPPQWRQQREGGQSQTRKSFATRALDLLKSTAKEWSRDKCPQLVHCFSDSYSR
jgi:hypothetical protein